MAHGITAQDGMFSVRQVPWHGLGAVLDDYPTLTEAKEIAHPWEPEEMPVYRRVVEPAIYDPFTGATQREQVRYEEIVDHKAIARSDNGSVLDVANATYQPVTNQVLYDVAEALEGEAKGEVQLETGGSINGGRKVWLLVRLREALQIDGDPNGGTIPYFMLQNSHDGSGSFKGSATFVRVVCQNTIIASDMDAKARGTEFTFRHSQSIHDRIEQAKNALAGWKGSLGLWQEMTSHLNGLRVDDAARREFIEEFIPMPMPHMATDRVRNNVEEARQKMRTILDSPTCEGISHTAHGLVAASVEYNQHYRRAHGKESRFKRAMIDPSVITRDAIEIAQKVGA